VAVKSNTCQKSKYSINNQDYAPCLRRLAAAAASPIPSSMSSSNGSNSFDADDCFFPAVPDLRLPVTAGSSVGSSEALGSSSDAGPASFVDLHHKCHDGWYRQSLLCATPTAIFSRALVSCSIDILPAPVPSRTYDNFNFTCFDYLLSFLQTNILAQLLSLNGEYRNESFTEDW